MARNWKQAEDDFVAAFETRGGKQVYIERLLDAAEIFGRTARFNISGRGSMSDRPQPADYIVVAYGKMFYAEVKTSKNANSFPLSNISVDQINSARRTIAAGGDYQFFLKSEVLDQWYRVPALVVLKATAKSLKWLELSPYKWNMDPCNIPT
jgi:hypothetical protein